MNKYLAKYSALMCIAVGMASCSDDVAEWQSDDSIQVEVLLAETPVTRADITDYDNHNYWTLANALNNGTTSVTSFGLFSVNASGSIVSDENQNQSLNYINNIYSVVKHTAGYNYMVYGPYCSQTADNGSTPYVTFTENNGSKVFSWFNLNNTSENDVLVPHQISAVEVVNGNNNISLYVDHAYARFDIYFALTDQRYAAMRDVQIKSVTITGLPEGQDNLTCTFDSNNKSTLAWTNNPSSYAGSSTINKDNFWLKDYDETSEQKYSHLFSTLYLRPTSGVYTKTGEKDIVMTVVYDTYDTESMETRHDQKVDISLKSMMKDSDTPFSQAGTRYRVLIQINPDYLYVLSDNDQSNTYTYAIQ